MAFVPGCQERSTAGRPPRAAQSSRRQRRRWPLLLVAVSTLATLAACNDDATPSPDHSGPPFRFDPTAEIVISDSGVQPSKVAAKVDQALRVINRAAGVHRLTSDSLDTGVLQPGQETTLFLTRVGRIELKDTESTEDAVALTVTVDEGPTVPGG
jgi:hypothetical protein